MKIRTITLADYAPLIAVVDDWWDGRHVAAMLPRLFFIHFRVTSFIAEADGQRIGFVVGFPSPAMPEEAYIHFVGVHPDHRRSGVAKALYERFLRIAGEGGRERVKCVTSPGNTPSIAFHRAMGFSVEASESGTAARVHRDYDGPGETAFCS